MSQRILTITSGKGGVGKTTVAISLGLAMSRYGSVVLIDRDLETGSVRSFLDMEVPRDLYHCIVRGVPLRDCITPLPERWDPQGRYRRFGLVAAPRHFIEDFSGRMSRVRERLVEEIHGLNADVVIMDMRAGLSDENVESMPYSNSGILVFTPRLPAAAGAAANLIKAQIFRKLLLALQPPSPLVAGLSPRYVDEVHQLIAQADDVYDEEVPNLDAVIFLLEQRWAKHPVAAAIRRLLSSFFVHYVLNHFDGVEDSYDRAVRPFVQQLAELVSARLDVRNLGWIEYNRTIHEANCRRIPALLYNEVNARAADTRRPELEEIERMVQRLEPKAPSGGATQAGVNRYLNDQLHHLERMYKKVGASQFPTQFEYLAAAAWHRMATLRPYSFGDTRLLSPAELQQLMMDYHGKN